MIYATTRVNSFTIFLLSLFNCRQNLCQVNRQFFRRTSWSVSVYAFFIGDFCWTTEDSMMGSDYILYLNPDTFLCACQVTTQISIFWWRCHLCFEVWGSTEEWFVLLWLILMSVYIYKNKINLHKHGCVRYSLSAILFL